MRKVMALMGSGVLLLTLGAPAAACDCEGDGGHLITIGVAGLPGHELGEYVPPTGVRKVTICHYGQNHDTDWFVAWVYNNGG